MSKMSKLKNVLLVATSWVLVAAIAVAGTLAYLQDDDSDVNVMTLGSVSIVQHEYERVLNADGTYEMVTSASGTGYKLQEFTQAKPLLPGVGSVTGWGTKVYADQLGTSIGALSVLEGMENVQDKFISVENTGKTDAYVRTLIAFEQGTMSVEKFGALVMMSLNDYSWAIENIGTIAIDNNNYYMYELVYSDSRLAGEAGVLPAGTFTSFSLGQVYLKPEATNEDCEALDGNNNGTYDILVVSQAVQAGGFADAQTALDTAFGDITTTNHPWTDGVAIPSAPFVSTVDDLKAALEAGESVSLATDLALDKAFVIDSGKTATIDLAGNTLSLVSTEAKASCAIENKGTLTLKNGTVTYEGVGDTAYGYGTNTINNSGKLIIEGATIINTTNAGSSNAIDCAPGSELIVNDGVIKSEKNTIRLRDNATATINGGEISGARAVQIHLFQNVQKPTSLTINGGTLTGDYALYSYANGSCTFSQTTVTITGGTFNGTVAFGGGNKTATETVSITGGTFNGDLGRYLANDGWEDIAKP